MIIFSPVTICLSRDSTAGGHLPAGPSAIQQVSESIVLLSPRGDCLLTCPVCLKTPQVLVLRGIFLSLRSLLNGQSQLTLFNNLHYTFSYRVSKIKIWHPLFKCQEDTEIFVFSNFSLTNLHRNKLRCPLK